jgi:hypothetical protein
MQRNFSFSASAEAKTVMGKIRNPDGTWTFVGTSHQGNLAAQGAAMIGNLGGVKTGGLKFSGLK